MSTETLDKQAISRLRVPDPEELPEKLRDPTQGLLPYADREILATVTSAENGCSYCRLNHAGSLGEALGDRRLGTRVAIDFREVRELSPRHRVLAEFASTLALHWRDAGAADGFVVTFSHNPGGAEDFVDGVVPLLRSRGLLTTGAPERAR